MYIGSGRRRRRSGGFAWLILLLLGVVLIGGYALVQQRLGNGLSFTSSGKATPLPAPTPTRSVENFVALADDAYKKGNYREAIRLYDQAIRRRPNDANLYAQSARLMVFIGQAAKAEQRARKALQLDPNSSPGEAVLCMSLDWQQRFEEALAHCQTATQLDPKSSMAYAYLAEVQTDTGDIQGGRASANQALTLDPRNEDAMRNLAYTYELGNNYTDAIYYYGKTLDLNPNMPHVLIALARCYATDGQVPKAILYYKQATQIDPQNAEAYDHMGGAYIAIEDYEMAKPALNKAIELDPLRWTAFARRGMLNFQLKRYESSVADYTTALTTSQTVSASLSMTDYLYYGFALQLQTNMDCEKALYFFDKVAAMAPDDQSVQDTLKTGYRRCGR